MYSVEACFCLQHHLNAPITLRLERIVGRSNSNGEAPTRSDGRYVCLLLNALAPGYVG